MSIAGAMRMRLYVNAETALGPKVAWQMSSVMTKMSTSTAGLIQGLLKHRNVEKMEEN